ncbi:class I SAM-dependent methyltransferase [Microvirga guangxiensis]|uniref:SAM-dependent methyltransferase n=1 Tax=Microvirga guangxiensis TaxID=549386 RepID=A0A1G5L7R1_9HYPH|nr:class I SAM-dependent methyltransferase [Microvirga guangxiensis]SCZ08993.1 SAM-dependent methyltransferase [Microvirga guangxiensis]
MTNWSSGYVTDVEYTHGFYKGLTPNLLSLYALLRGVQAPGADLEPRTYCELGCGQGYTANVLAAGNPHIEFYATDFNPSHIAGAQDLARAAKLGNVHFSNDSFGEYLQRDDLPDFDFITLHGIYSWISAEARQEIVRFIARKLKPGGIVYISYNCMPGWASVMPLRRLMIEHADMQGASRPLLPRISASLDFAETLNRLEASYFQSQPSLAGRIERIKKNNLNYVAHEYFNRDLTPFYFMDVARELSEAKLTWVGPASTTAGLDMIHLTQEQRDLLAGIDDVHFRETVRDHIINQQFRSDIFVKGPVRPGAQAITEKWLDTRFALTNGNPSQDMKGSRFSIKLNPDLFNGLVAALTPGPRALREIASLPELERFKLDRILQGIFYLIDQNACHPCLPDQGLLERKLRAERFNAVAAERVKSGAPLNTFASPVLGGGVPHDRIGALIWLALHNEEKDLSQAVLNHMNQAGLKVSKEGQELKGADESLRVLEAHLAVNDEKVRPFWKSLGLLRMEGGNAKREQKRMGA